MPSDNETESGSSGTADARSSSNSSVRHRQWHQPRRPPTTQGESRSKQSRTRWLPSKVRWQLGDQSRCRNLGTRTPKNWDVLRRYEMAGHAQKWTDEDLLAMLPLF
ncbi:hypothetical protein BV898_08469 [Hypsibius exemplaris]|uniref:Uncharacterized protein n=1 Tax=Hypsibius exemplaris TaxID=2072580 RepID=A0A1W0WQ90_HYPEX|nr:hypothetical protein BV898_08469 [Hypsibius exemplaris]